MPVVHVREEESFENALRRFKRKVEKSGILTELRKRQHFEKPSVKRKRKAVQARKKMMRKLLEERRQGLTIRRGHGLEGVPQRVGDLDVVARGTEEMCQRVGAELEGVALTLDRWTKYKGGVWDNRPTSAGPDLEPHATPGYAIRHAAGVKLKACGVVWGTKAPDDFTNALTAENVTGLELTGFTGTAAHPGRDPDLLVR